MELKVEAAQRLKGKVAIVTGGGGTNSIGRSICIRYAEEGARVAVADIDGASAAAVAQEITDGGGVAIAVTCDVRDLASCEAMAKAVADTWGGKIDILVNNAAIEMNKSVVEMDPGIWRHTLENNLTGPFLMMKAALPAMIGAGGGSIINVSSLAGVRAVPGGPAYCTTKAGLIHLSKQVALDYGKHNVRCNVICPGPARTALLEMNVHPLTEVLDTDLDGVFDKMSAFVPLRRIAKPADMTGLFVFLASDDSDFMTGSTLVMDGGIHIVDAFAAGVGTLGGEWG
jgi:NAD(P)-dependent dehydrogenase (short-subunit alcohol dehydrogenase family)